MGRRKGNSVPFSLFAFQDIITSVTGIILLITMMMALELVQNMQRAASAPQEQKSSAVEQTLRGAIEENSQEIVRLERLLEETTTIRFDADALRRWRVPRWRRASARRARRLRARRARRCLRPLGPRRRRCDRARAR
jgi:hypothetical protein